MKRVYCYLIAEPFTWIFSCLFQPTIFKEEFATKKLSQRGLVMFRLALPMFLCSYLLVPVSLLIFSPNPETFHLSSVGICVLGILCGVLLGIYYDIGWGITAGIGWGLAATNGTNLTDSMILSLSMSIGWATIGQHKALDLTSSMLHNIDVILRAKPILTKMVIRPILVILRVSGTPFVLEC